jgi:low affinity Fe/Cu permease
MASKVSNTFIGIEHLTHHEIEELRAECEARVRKKLHGS